MFLRTAWYVAGWSHHFAAGALVPQTILGEPIVLYRTSTGGVAALEDRCCHRFAPLSRGRLEGDDLRCMYHGLKFSTTGRCVEIPSQDQIPPAVKVRSYPVVEQDKWIWVWMGDPTKADASLIPRALNHENDDFFMRTGEMSYKANYQYVHDNLLDLTHLSFVHEKTLARRDRAWDKARPIVTPLERGVRVSRWLRNRGTPPYVPPPHDAVDQWASFDFVVPGVFLLNSSGYPVGTADSFPDGPHASLEPKWMVHTSQAVTPVESQQTKYYFSGCQPKALSEESSVVALLKVFDVAFAEDKSMIEAQQRVIDQTPNGSMMTLQFDRSIALFRQLMAKLKREEQVPLNTKAAAE